MLLPSNYTTLPFALATFCPACVFYHSTLLNASLLGQNQGQNI